MKRILFLCSPGLGSIDNWAPILAELKKKNKIDFFTPKIDILSDDISFKQPFFYKILKTYFSNIFCLSKKKDEILRIKNLDFKRKNLIQEFANISNKILLKTFKKEFNFFNYFENKIYSKKIDNVDYSNFLNRYSYILCDAIEFTKPYLKNFSKYSKNITKVSMPHGSDFPFTKKFKGSKKNYLGYNFKIILFSKTKGEKDYYQTILKLKNNNYLRSGNPKHDKRWINFIQKKNKNNLNTISKNKRYIFIVSRHADQIYFTNKNKIRALNMIKKIIMEKKNINVIIKPHPKENLYEYYFKIFGKDLYNVKWKFSYDHQYIVSKNAFCSITFFSGVSTDMNILGIPNIEIINLKEVTENIDKKDLFFKKNIPMFRIRYHDLTLGADNEIEFEKLIEKISKNKKKVMMNLRKNYNKNYINSDSTKKIMKIIK